MTDFYSRNPGAKSAFAATAARHDATNPSGFTPHAYGSPTNGGGSQGDLSTVANSGGALWNMGASRMSGMQNFANSGSSPTAPSGGPTATGMAFRMEDGGAVPELQDNSNDPITGSISHALQAVEEAMMHGRQKYGLGDGQQQMAFNPSQSDTGAVRPQPSPGPLPPTDKPFGQRGNPPPRMSQNDQDNDGDDDSSSDGDTDKDVAGAIPEEETA